jgi:hypothetical protein
MVFVGDPRYEIYDKLTDRNPQAWQDHSTPNRAAFESVMMT